MTEFERLKRKAEKKGWKVPVNDVFPNESWIHYWRACEEYARNPESGRPVPPHRSA